MRYYMERLVLASWKVAMNPIPYDTRGNQSKQSKNYFWHIWRNTYPWTFKKHMIMINNRENSDPFYAIPVQGINTMVDWSCDKLESIL